MGVISLWLCAKKANPYGQRRRRGRRKKKSVA
jgi:hypothetical protein